MKDIHEINDNQPLSFNYIHCMGVAGSVLGTILFLKEAHSPRNIDRPEEAHQNNANSS